MRRLHRQLAIFAIILGLFKALTGLAIQSMDLTSELSHAPASDPTVMARHAGLFGPPNFQVIDIPDFSAAAMPSRFDFATALNTTLKAAHSELGRAAISFVQFRMRGSQPIGQVGSKGQLYSFDVANGAPVGQEQRIVLKPISTPSLRNTLKDIHRLRWFGGWAIFLDTLIGLLLSTAIVSGLFFYAQLWQARARIKRRAPYWFAGTWWRTLHRATAITAALFLAVIAVSGTILSISSIGVVVATAFTNGKRPAIVKDLSSPLSDTELPQRLESALQSFRKDSPDTPIKVLRLRNFAGMPQAVFVTGGETTDQIVVNTATGARASLSEPNYPAPGQTFGWQVDETVKKIHRGDAFGITGMALSLLSGFALLYLSVSGAIMYFELWKRRSRQGKRQLIW